MTRRIKFSLITFVTAIVLFFAGLFAITMPTKTASAATQTTISGFSLGTTNAGTHLVINVGEGSFPSDFPEGDIRVIDANFVNDTVYAEGSFSGQVGVTASGTTMNFFPATAKLGDKLMVPQGKTISYGTDGNTVVFGEKLEVWYNGTSWQMTEPVVLSDFTFGANNAAGYFDLAVGSGEMPADFVTYGSANNLSFADGTFSSSTWDDLTFPYNVGVLASSATNFQIFPSNHTATAGEVITIPQGATIIANGYCVVFGEEIKVTFDGTAWTGLEDQADQEVETTPMTISALESNSTYNGTMYQLYVTVDVSATATWTGWDNSANVVLNGTSTKADGWCFNNTNSLYMQLTTAEIANPLTFAKGTVVTINNIAYEIANDFNVYYYDDALHTEPKPTATPMTLTSLDTTRTVYSNGTYQLYFYTDITNTGATWGGWDNSTTVLVNGTATRADWCFANTGANSLLYVQVTTAEVANPITVVKGTQVTINGTLYEIAANFNIYHYDDAFHTEAKVEATPMTLTSLDTTRTVYASGTYQLYFYTDITNNGATWGGWDNSTTVLVNGTATRADWCFANTGANSLLYVQVTTAETEDPITIAQGTQVAINEIIYEISADFNVYHYNDAFHTEPKPATTLMTLGALQSNSTFSGSQYALYISVDVTAEFTWADEGYKWDNSTHLLVGNVSTRADWCFSNTNELYVQVSSTEFAQPLTIKAGTLLTINDTLYEVANDFSISYYKVTKTVNGETTTEYATGDYILPEVEKSGYMHLGWVYNGGLYEIGDTFAAATTVEGFAIEAVYADFTQLDGASIKMGSALSGTGIRFTARLGEKNDYILKMGVLVMPVDYMTKGEFVHANYTVDKDYLEFIATADELSVENFQNNGNAYYVKGSVVKLFESNYQRTFVGRSFLVVNYADGEKYVYVDSNSSEHERKICDVAQAALEDATATYTTEQKKILLSYTAEELISYAYFGPTATSDFVNYADLDMDVIWLDMIPYRAHERYATPWNADLESWLYNEPASADRDLKGAIAAAKEQGLKVIVYDVGIRRLSESKIPLIAEDPANPQLLGLWLQTAETETAEVLGADADESAFDQANMTYTYSGSNFAGTDKAKVLKYLYQFESEAALKEYISILMSQYAKESNFYGVMLADEPTEDMYAQLALVKKIIAELYPNAYTQSCQFPSYHYDSFDVFKTTIESYASQIAGNGDLGLDFYPFLDEELSIWDQIFGADTKTENGVRINWLATMQYVAQTAAKYDLDFENTVQSHGMSEGYTSVSAAELALQVQLSLAFGADKVSYFTYNGHDEGGLTMTQYINNDTALAAAVTEANTEGDYIKKNMVCFEYSKSKLYGVSSDCLNTDNFTQSDLTKNIIASASNSVLVNEFYNEITGEYGYYIVNITIPDNATSVTVNLNGAATVYQNGASSSSASITLAAGEGVFVVVA